MQANSLGERALGRRADVGEHGADGHLVELAAVGWSTGHGQSSSALVPERWSPRVRARVPAVRSSMSVLFLCVVSMPAFVVILLPHSVLWCAVCVRMSVLLRSIFRPAAIRAVGQASSRRACVAAQIFALQGLYVCSYSRASSASSGIPSSLFSGSLCRLHLRFARLFFAHRSSMV